MRGLYSILSFSIAAVLISIAPSRAIAQTDAAALRNFPWEGEVTGTAVYIRSGAGGNYYPTTKVGPGTRLLVVGEKFGWYEIVPPVGSFSYIDQSLVEKSEDGKTGTVSQENVYVRAGSELERRKTSTQVLLTKGATVSIVGDADGFYKIVPPKGAHLFISAQYVAQVPERTRSGLLEKYMSEGGPVSSAVTPTVVDAKPVMKNNPTPTPSPKPDETPRSINTDVAITPPVDDRIASTPHSEPPPVNVDVNRRPEPIVSDGVAANPTYRPSTPGRPVSDNGTTGWIESKFAANDGSSPSVQANPDNIMVSTSDNAAPGVSANFAPVQPAPASTPTPVSTPSPYAISPPSNAKSVDGRNVTTIEVTSATGAGRYDTQVQMLEAEMQSELRKPIVDQKLASLRDRFGPISTQSEDQVAREIAKIRIRQLNDRIALQMSRMALAAESKELEAFRRRSDEERIAIARRVASYSAPPSYDVIGELRKSAAFGPEKRRYRLVSPKEGTTIGYVDVPADHQTNVDQWIGQMVGVKAAGRNYSNAARMTFYVAESITPIGGGSGAADDSEPISDSNIDEPVIEFTESTTPVAKTAPRPTTAVKPQANATPRPIAPAAQPVKPSPVARPVAAPRDSVPSDDPAANISFSSPKPTFSSPASANQPSGPVDDTETSNPAPTGNTPPNGENTDIEPLEPLD